MILTTLTNH